MDAVRRGANSFRPCLSMWSLTCGALTNCADERLAAPRRGGVQICGSGFEGEVVKWVVLGSERNGCMTRYDTLSGGGGMEQGGLRLRNGFRETVLYILADETGVWCRRN